jgi:hypothetical membrane protein
MNRSSAPVTARAARLAIGASALFILCLAALHVLRPDIDPSWHFISDYEVGEWGWVMRVAFLSLATSCFVALIAVAPHARGIIGRLGMLVLCVSGCGIALAGLFAPSTTNTLHETGAMLDQLPLAALLISIGLWRNNAWRSARATLAGSLLVLWVGMAVFIGAMVVMQPSKDRPPSPDMLVGWPSRVFILAHAVWLISVGWCAAQIGSTRCTDDPGTVAASGSDRITAEPGR